MRPRCAAALVGGCGAAAAALAADCCFFVCAETATRAIEEAFKDFSTRDDVAVVLINQYIADMIRHVVNDYNKACVCLHPTAIAENEALP